MVKELEIIAYKGDCFTIEWYFNDKEQSEALEYYRSLSAQERIKLLKLFKRMGDSGKIQDKTKFMHEGDKIYAFKPQPERFLCFFYDGKKIIVTNAFRKKQQKLPKNQKYKAINIRESYLIRNKEGNYYE
jgi:hypothetical protein